MYKFWCYLLPSVELLSYNLSLKPDYLASALVSTTASVPSSTAASALSSKRVVLSSIGNNIPPKRQTRARTIDMNENQSDDDDDDDDDDVDDEKDGNYESESEDESKIKKKKPKQEWTNIVETKLVF